MAKLKELIPNYAELMEKGIGQDELIAIAQKRSQNRVQEVPQEAEATQPVNGLTYTGASKDVMESRGVVPQMAKGLANNFVRATEALNGVTGIKVPYYDKLVKLGEDLEAQKEKNAERFISPDRKDERDALKQEAQNAKGFVEDVKVGVKQMADVVTHPSEWTIQGAVETLSDPSNAITLGAGKVAGTLFKTPVLKFLAGGVAGAGENALTASATEYAIARGQGKSVEEAKKIATQAAAGGAALGGVIGGAGSMIPDAKATPKTLDPSVSEVNNFAKTVGGNRPTDGAEGGEGGGTPPPNSAFGNLGESDGMFDFVESEIVASKNDVAIRGATQQLLDQGVTDPLQLKAVIDTHIQITDTDRMITMATNGAELPKEYMGSMLPVKVTNTIEAGTQTPQEVHARLKSIGASDELASIVVQAVEAKNPDLFHAWWAKKLQPLMGKKAEVTQPQISLQETPKMDTPVQEAPNLGEKVDVPEVKVPEPTPALRYKEAQQVALDKMDEARKAGMNLQKEESKTFMQNMDEIVKAGIAQEQKLFREEKMAELTPFLQKEMDKVLDDVQYSKNPMEGSSRFRQDVEARFEEFKELQNKSLDELFVDGEPSPTKVFLNSYVNDRIRNSESIDELNRIEPKIYERSPHKVTLEQRRAELRRMGQEESQEVPTPKEDVPTPKEEPKPETFEAEPVLKEEAPEPVKGIDEDATRVASMENVYHPDNEVVGKQIFLAQGRDKEKHFVAGEKIDETIIDGLEFYWNKTDKSIHEKSSGLNFPVEATTKEKAIQEAQGVLAKEPSKIDAIKRRVEIAAAELDNATIKQDTREGSAWIDGFEMPIEVATAIKKESISPIKSIGERLYDANESLRKLVTQTSNAEYSKDIKPYRLLKTEFDMAMRAAFQKDEKVANAYVHYRKMLDYRQAEKNTGNTARLKELDGKVKDAEKSIEIEEARVREAIKADPRYAQMESLKAKLEKTEAYKDKDLRSKLKRAQEKVKKIEQEVKVRTKNFDATTKKMMEC